MTDEYHTGRAHGTAFRVQGLTKTSRRAKVSAKGIKVSQCGKRVPSLTRGAGNTCLYTEEHGVHRVKVLCAPVWSMGWIQRQRSLILLNIHFPFLSERIPTLVVETMVTVFLISNANTRVNDM